MGLVAYASYLTPAYWNTKTTIFDKTKRVQMQPDMDAG